MSIFDYLQLGSGHKPVFTPEEQQQVQSGFHTSLRQAPNALVSMPLTIAAPDPQLPGPLGYIPGAGLVEATGGLLDFVGRSGATVANAAMPERWGLRVPDPPAVLGQMGERFEQNRAEVKGGLEKYTGGILKQPEMDTPAGEAADVFGSAVGAGVGVLPAAMLNAVPRGLKTITSLVLAPKEHMGRNIPINMGVAAGFEGSNAYFHPANAGEPDVAETATPPAASTTVAQAQQALPVPPIPPATPPPAPVADDPLSQYMSTKGKGGASSQATVPFGDAVLAGSTGPTFVQQGNTGVTWGEALVGLGLTFGAIAGGRKFYRHGATIDAAARDARLQDPAYAQQVNDYHNDVIKRGPGAGPLGGDEAPPPLPQGSAVRKTTTWLADKMGNDAAKYQNMMDLIAENPTVAQKLSSQIGNMHDSSLQHNEVLRFAETGVERQTRIRMPSLVELARDVAALPDDQQVILKEGLRARNEKENRENNMREFAADNKGKTPTVADIHHDFFGKTLEDLHLKIALMENDPALMAMAERYWKVPAAMVDIGHHPAYKFFDAAEAAKLKKFRKYHVAEFDSDGQLKHPFGPRDTSLYTGQAQGGVDPITALVAHVEQMYPLFKRNQLNQQLYAAQKNFMARPGAPQYITDIANPTGPHTNYYPTSGMKSEVSGQARDPIVTLREDGIKHLRIDDTDMLHLMRGDSLTKSRVHLGALDVLRRTYQKGTTAAVSLLTGRAMPIRNMAFAAPVMAWNQPFTRRAGLLDWGMQKMVGNEGRLAQSARVMARGGDMILNPLVMPASGIIAPVERTINRIAELFHPKADNFANRQLRALLDDATVDAMHKSAASWFERSTTNFNMERGVTGQGSPVQTDAPGIAVGTKASQLGGDNAALRLETARLAPQAFINGNWAGTARIAGIRLQNAVGEMFNGISEVPHDFFTRINRSNPHVDPETLVYETRNLVGNPARHGSGSFMQGASSALPYTNVSVQGTGRALRAFGENPVAAPMTMVMGLGYAAALMIFTHMRSAAHLDFLQNQLSLQQRESGIALALNDDPAKPTIFPIAQEFQRALFPLVLDLVAKGVNIIAGRHDPDVFKAMWDGLTAFLGSNITSSSLHSAIHGVVDMVDFANLPPWAGRVDWNAVLHGKSPLDAYHSVAGGVNEPAPGQGADAPLDSTSGQIIERVLSSILGAVGSAIEIPNSAYRYHAQGHGFMESLGMAGHDWLQTAGESNLMLNNVVMETQMRLSIRPPLVEALQPSLYATKHLPVSVSASMEGFVSPGYGQQPVPLTIDKSVSSDLLIRQMLNVAHGYSTKIEEALKPAKAIEAQMQTWQKQGLNPADRRAWLNDRTRDLTDKYKLVDSYVSDMDNALSNMAGRGIRIEDIDWKRDSSQFK